MPCAWSEETSKLQKKSSALLAGSIFWRRAGKICATQAACSERIWDSLQ